jgi:crossover junction endodeoxyribonuclease RusA
VSNLIEIELPFPPSANRYWRNVNGRMVKSAEARVYRDEAGWLALQALTRSGRRADPLAGELRISLDFYRPARRGDLDNRIKVCLDALQGIAFENDSQIAEIHARRFEDKQSPRVEIRIGSLDDALRTIGATK